MADYGTSVVSQTRHGVPHQELEEFCTLNDMLLLVMGTHSRSGLTRQLIRGVTERSLRHSNGPIMTGREVYTHSGSLTKRKKEN